MSTHRLSSSPGILGGLLVMTILFTSKAQADNPSASQSSPGVMAEEQAPQNQHAPVDDRETEKQRRAMAGLLALCGILIGGLMFVVLVMVWGARLRRMARAELPAQRTLDKDLWFLKPPKPPQP